MTFDFDVFAGAVASSEAGCCADAASKAVSRCERDVRKQAVSSVESYNPLQEFPFGVRMSEPSTTSQLYVGTSGWAYTIWKPEFYPKNVASKNFLKHYATQLNTVEVNYTFRRSLTEKAATGWMADVGPNFRFALKANQYITHIRKLQNCEEPVQRFLATLQPLATQLGPGAVSAWSDAEGRRRRAARFSRAAAAEFQGGV